MWVPAPGRGGAFAPRRCAASPAVRLFYYRVSTTGRDNFVWSQNISLFQVDQKFNGRLITVTLIASRGLLDRDGDSGRRGGTATLGVDGISANRRPARASGRPEPRVRFSGGSGFQTARRAAPLRVRERTDGLCKCPCPRVRQHVTRETLTSLPNL